MSYVRWKAKCSKKMEIRVYPTEHVNSREGKASFAALNCSLRATKLFR